MQEGTGATVPVPPALGALPADWQKQVGDFLGESRAFELDMVYDQAFELRARGIFEPCLLEALTGLRTNLHLTEVPQEAVRQLLDFADPVRLRTVGPLPALPGRRRYYRLYRGVAGTRDQRQIRGLFWTDSLEYARWFALRWPQVALSDPAVYTVRVHHLGIYAYYNGRHERDFLVRPEWLGRPRRLETLVQGSTVPRPTLD